MRNSVFYSYILVLLFPFMAHGQLAPDFTITDTEGQSHTLYEDYLDKGVTVVIKIFFVACPPCNAIAPHVQSLYEEWGEGAYDVQFIELSNKSFDSNADVAVYKAQHGLTFPGAGEDGGALTALGPYLSGMFGPVYGTPHFIVISPDGSVLNDPGGSGIQGQIDALHAAIAATGATGMGQEEELPAEFNIAVTDLFNNPVWPFDLYLESGDDPSISYPVNLENGYLLSITDLSVEFPAVSNPHLRIVKEDAIKEKISAIDLLIIIRHILGVQRIDNIYKEMAADTNNDGLINALDLLSLQRIILGISSEFPNSDSYRFIPETIPLVLEPGTLTPIQFMAIKVGDLNGF